MGGVYTVTAGNFTVAGAVTLVFINPKATVKGFRILRVSVSQSANATSAQQRVQLVSQVTAFPTLTSATPRPHSIGDNISQIVGGTAGAAGTCGTNASAEGAGAKTVMYEECFNVLNGFLYVPTPREQPIFHVAEASGFGVYFPTAPGTTTGWSASVTFEED